MGIADRDYYRDHARAKGRTRATRGGGMGRIALIWLAVLAALFVGCQWWARTRSTTATSVGPAPQIEPVQRDRAAGATVNPQAQAPVTVAPVAPPAAPIYRCGNAYSTVACAGGRIVAQPAASGFDSRPSERLSQLVAQGRPANDGSSTVTQTVTTTTQNGVVTSTTNNVATSIGSCAWLAADLDAIDRAARRPLSMGEQDRLRLRRKDDRDRQLRQGC